MLLHLYTGISDFKKKIIPSNSWRKLYTTFFESLLDLFYHDKPGRFRLVRVKAQGAMLKHFRFKSRIRPSENVGTLQNTSEDQVELGKMRISKTLWVS